MKKTNQSNLSLPWTLKRSQAYQTTTANVTIDCHVLWDMSSSWTEYLYSRSFASSIRTAMANGRASKQTSILAWRNMESPSYNWVLSCSIGMPTTVEYFWKNHCPSWFTTHHARRKSCAPSSKSII